MSGAKQKSLLLTDKEAAELLAIGRSKLWTMVHSGLLSPVKLPPRATRFRRRDIEKLAGVVEEKR